MNSLWCEGGRPHDFLWHELSCDRCGMSIEDFLAAYDEAVELERVWKGSKV